MTIDLCFLAEKLREAGIEDVVIQAPHLIVLLEDIGVVAQIYQSGTIHLQATLRDDVERTCDLIYAVALAENGQSRNE
jgi:hypothetical protein